MKRKVKMKPRTNEIIFAKNNLFTFFYQENMEEIDDGIFIYKSPVDDYMHPMGIVGAAATKIKFKTITGKEIVCNTIVHDSAFEKLPKYVQRFLVSHEIGHIVNGDIDNLTEKESTNLIIKRVLGILPTMEICADSYAASIIGTGNAKESLKWLIRNTDLPIISKIELFRRCRRLSK